MIKTHLNTLVPIRQFRLPRRSLVLLLAIATLGPTPASAIEVHISAPALERTLKNQVFITPPPSPDLPARVYLSGKPGSGCAVFADSPQVSFKDDRVVVKVNTHANFGASVRGRCVGLWLNTESVVSFIPEAEGESIGFRDARIDKLTDSRELNLLLEPFLAHKLPAQMKVNAATLMRTLLVHAPDSTGYTLTLSSLKLHSMLVERQSLVVDLDANIAVE